MQSIIKEVNNLGICKDFQRKFKTENDYKNVFNWFFTHEDWSIENNFPNVELAREYKEIGKEYNFFVDYQGFISDPLNAAFLGNSTAFVDCEGFTVSKIIVKDEANVKLTIKGYAKVFLHITQNAKIECEALENSQIVIFRYSPAALIEKKGNVKILEKWN